MPTQRGTGERRAGGRGEPPSSEEGSAAWEWDEGDGDEGDGEEEEQEEGEDTDPPVLGTVVGEGEADGPLPRYPERHRMRGPGKFNKSPQDRQVEIKLRYHPICTHLYSTAPATRRLSERAFIRPYRPKELMAAYGLHSLRGKVCPRVVCTCNLPTPAGARAAARQAGGGTGDAGPDAEVAGGVFPPLCGAGAHCFPLAAAGAAEAPGEGRGEPRMCSFETMHLCHPNQLQGQQLGKLLGPVGAGDSVGMVWLKGEVEKVVPHYSVLLAPLLVDYAYVQPIVPPPAGTSSQQLHLVAR